MHTSRYHRNVVIRDNIEPQVEIHDDHVEEFYDDDNDDNDDNPKILNAAYLLSLEPRHNLFKIVIIKSC